MAEIKIEKKKPIWPWILVILVILAIIAYFVLNNRYDDDLTDDYDDMNTEQFDDSTNRQLDNQDNQDAYDNSTLNDDMSRELVLYNESINDRSRIATDSIYTKTAYMNLARAVVRAANDNNLESSQNLEDLKSFSDQTLSTDPSRNSTANAVSKNFKTISDKVTEVLQRIQTKNYPTLDSEISDLKMQASKMETTTNMSSQQEQIQSFLEKARDILKSMNS